MAKLPIFQKSYNSSLSDQAKLNNYISGLISQLGNDLGVDSLNIINNWDNSEAYCIITITDRLDSTPALQPTVLFEASATPSLESEYDIEITDLMSFVGNESTDLVSLYDERKTTGDYDEDTIANDIDVRPNEFDNPITIGAWVLVDEDVQPDFNYNDVWVKGKVYVVTAIDGDYLTIEDSILTPLLGTRTQQLFETSVLKANFKWAGFEEIAPWLDTAFRIYTEKNKTFRFNKTSLPAYDTEFSFIGAKLTQNGAAIALTLPGGTFNIFSMSTGAWASAISYINKTTQTTIPIVHNLNNIYNTETITYNGKTYYQV